METPNPKTPVHFRTYTQLLEYAHDHLYADERQLEHFVNCWLLRMLEVVFPEQCTVLYGETGSAPVADDGGWTYDPKHILRLATVPKLLAAVNALMPLESLEPGQRKPTYRTYTYETIAETLAVCTKGNVRRRMLDEVFTFNARASLYELVGPSDSRELTCTGGSWCDDDDSRMTIRCGGGRKIVFYRSSENPMQLRMRIKGPDIEEDKEEF